MASAHIVDKMFFMTIMCIGIALMSTNIGNTRPCPLLDPLPYPCASDMGSLLLLPLRSHSPTGATFCSLLVNSIKMRHLPSVCRSGLNAVLHNVTTKCSAKLLKKSSSSLKA